MSPDVCSTLCDLRVCTGTDRTVVFILSCVIVDRQWVITILDLSFLFFFSVYSKLLIKGDSVSLNGRSWLIY